MCVSVFGLTSCQNEMDNLGGKEVTLRVTANRGEAATRTTLAPDGEGNLACTWDNGDQLLVVKNSDGSKLGVITLVSGAGNDEGVFEGKVNLDGHDAVSLVYLGKAGDAETYADKYLALNVSAQDGTLASLTSKDVLAAEAAIKDGDYVSYDRVETRVEMIRQLAHGYFELNFGDGVELEVGDEITITGEGLRSEGKVNFKNGGNVPTITNYTGSTTITVTKKEAGNDFYLTMLPVGNVTPTFTVEKDGVTYTAELGVHKWVSGEFVRAANTTSDKGFDPVTVSMEKVADDVDPTNPGFMSNWGGAGELIKPSYTDTREVSGKYSGNGWCYNQYSVYTGDLWCDPIIYHSNGIVNGALYSTRNASPSYYQWGRWMGFPYNASMLKINSYGQPINNYWAADNAFALGESIKDNARVKYQNTQYGSVYGGYFAIMNTTAWISSGWTNEMAKKASIIFGAASTQGNDYLDYIKSSDPLAGVCSWEDRSGNPCPDGWRIPTFAELRNLIPGGGVSGTVSGTKVEVREINGQKIAFRYKVTTNSDGIPCVNIESAPTSKSTVSTNDPVFDGAKVLTIGAYGFIGYNGSINKYKTQALIWSSDSYKNSYGVGGTCLIIEFSGSTASFIGSYQDRIYGMNIIPIRDENAKHTDLRPWFPYSEL